jgi:hypothetical protein
MVFRQSMRSLSEKSLNFDLHTKFLVVLFYFTPVPVDRASTLDLLGKNKTEQAKRSSQISRFALATSTTLASHTSAGGSFSSKQR